MLLEVDDLTKVYRSGTRANDGMSLQVAEGEVFGLLGPNGAGKTTLVSQLLGLSIPTSGTITMEGVDVVADPAHARRACSYQPQTTLTTAGLTPLQAVELCGRIRGGKRASVRARTRELVAALDLAEFSGRSTPLSGGVARLTAFCMAAVVPGRLVILDEPTNDVDPLRRRLLWQQVRALADAGNSVLLVTHNVIEAERCADRFTIVDRGRVVRTGTAAALKAELGGWLRLELLLEPGAPAPCLPSFCLRPAAQGSRLVAEVAVERAGEAVRWATSAQSAGALAEFSLSPASLEDVYVRAMSQ